MSTAGMPGYTGATLTLHIDPHEHQRRQIFRRRHFTSPDLLDLLLALPAGEPVPFQRLTVYQQRTVRRAPAGVLRIGGRSTDRTVTRLAVRPCRVALATVQFATACRTALESAARFAPFTARQVVVRRRPALPETLIEYGFWGVGLLHDPGDGPVETLVAPEPWRPKRHTPAGWRFAETAYGAYLTQQSTEAVR
ncbi:hypothetical protein [Streptomyces sp. NPDC047097]|uniref:hypothetical protein n=1 Tax=Streptomyces sp. NPDC047097 TaxID=3155260 RepID=UPI00340EF4F7